MDRYSAKIICRNCNNFVTEMIPSGMTISEWRNHKICAKCGCSISGMTLTADKELLEIEKEIAKG